MNERNEARRLLADRCQRALLGVAGSIVIALTASCETKQPESEAVPPVVSIEPQDDAPIDIVEPPTRPVPPQPRRKPAVDLSSRAAPSPEQQALALDKEPPVVEPKGLVGLDFVRAENLLGPPSLLIEEPPAKIWSYNGRDCVLQLFFYPKVGGAFEVLTYQALGGEGDRKPSNGDLVRECLSQLLFEREARNAENS